MSWLSAVTGKAEDFLNKLDKSAADVLADVTEGEEGPEGQLSKTEAGQSLAYSKRLAPSASVPAQLHDFKSEVDKTSSYVSGPVKSSPRTSTPNVKGPSSQKQAKGKKADDDLFDFLNSKDTESNKKKRTPVSSRHHSRQSSTSSISSKGAKPEISNLTHLETLQGFAGGLKPGDETSVQRDSPTDSHLSADVDALADAMKESPVESDKSGPGSDSHVAPDGDKDRQLSSLELENRLLRSEVASLNQEMSTVIHRAKEAERESARTAEALRSHSSSASLHDQLVRELQAREADLSEALKAKDAQLAVLRVRLDEADRHARGLESQVEEVKAERQRILQDHSDSSGVHGQALDAMKDKLEEVEAQLRREQQAYTQAQREAGDRQNRQEQEQRLMAESLTASEKRYTDEKAKNSDLFIQLKSSKSAAESARKELTDYKDKAARILQSKEKLISPLRGGGGAGLGDMTGGVSVLEHEAVVGERDMLREELQQTKTTAQNLRQELQEVELQLQQDADTAADTISGLEEALAIEKRRREDADNELLSQKQELQYTMEESRKQKTSYQSRISDRESEIERLRNQLMTKSMSSSTEGELESRVRSLTESLIQKQTVMEALSTEKNSLVLQLERTEQQLRDMESAIPRHQVSSQMVNMNDQDDDFRQRLPLFLREVPTDNDVTKRFKRYASSLDTFSIRLGVFLRRNPIFRVFVILYMILLHLWVLMVMMTYQPEIHGHDYMPHAPGAAPPAPNTAHLPNEAK